VYQNAVYTNAAVENILGLYPEKAKNWCWKLRYADENKKHPRGTPGCF